MTTLLRQTYERARALDAEKQLQECVDLIQNIEILVGEVVDAYQTAGGGRREVPTGAEATAGPVDSEEPGDEDLDALAAEYFYESRDIMVPGGTGAFTCLANDVVPMPGATPESGRNGLDFVAITCDGDAHPVLGAVQSKRDATPYALLLRSLACLAEIVTPRGISSVDRHYFRGLLGPAPSFDVNLVIFAAQDTAVTPLAELTRDLAEAVRAGLEGRADFPPVLRRVACLRMNPDRFDGRLRLDWRI